MFAASTIGRVTGRAAGYVAAARNRFASFTESAELAKVRTVIVHGDSLLHE